MMEPADLQDGLVVLYSPVSGQSGFPGVIDGSPWQLGSGHWVVNLRNMDPKYGDSVGVPGKRRVNAASLSHLNYF